MFFFSWCTTWACRASLFSNLTVGSIIRASLDFATNATMSAYLDAPSVSTQCTSEAFYLQQRLQSTLNVVVPPRD
uniref:Putative secreted protein n=1 Tax=Panstrongylus lignarius TaxID=156445 RepID=A0A224Y5R8_9HEMI